MAFHLHMKPSTLLFNDAEEADPVEFDWHCKEGLAENIKKVKDEFCKVRGLKPIRIFISGPPLSGKTFHGKKLAKHYNVPHIDLKQLIQEIKKITDETHPIYELI